MNRRFETPPQGNEERTFGYGLHELKATIEARNLPVRERFEELVQHIVHQIESGQDVVILEGETGSGKSVYTPAAVSEALRRTGRLEKILVMEPRKDATVGVAMATAAVQGAEIGKEVGYVTSEGAQRSAETLIHVVTPGVAIRYLLEGRADRERLGAVILDEVHERSTETDLAIGQLKRMRQEGRAPLLVLMSATADQARLERYFSLDASASIKIEGRAYPVSTTHALETAVVGEKNDAGQQAYLQRAVQEVWRVLEAGEGEKGDILVFLPGEAEIGDCITRLRAMPDLGAHEVDILGLFGRMKWSDRVDVLRGHRSNERRRVIFSTNVAESSVTVPGVTTVIDSGRVRIRRFDEREGIQKIEDAWISKAAAAQRAGRAGREAPGRCIRLYPSAQLERFSDHPIPQILLEKPSRLVLQLRRYGIDERTFPYYEAPNAVQLAQAHDELASLGLVDTEGKVTELGERVERLPFEPRISILLLECERRRCFESGLILAAASRESRIFAPLKDKFNGPDRRKEQERIRSLQEEAGLIVPTSDLFTLLEIFNQSIDEGVFHASEIAIKLARHQTPAEKAALQQFFDWAETYGFNPHALLHIAKRIKDYAADYFRSEDHEAAPEERRRFNIQDFCRSLEEEDGRNNPRDISVAIALSHRDRLYFCDGQRLFPLSGPETVPLPFLYPGSALFSPVSKPRPFVGVATIDAKDDPRSLRKNVWAKQIHRLPQEVLEEVIPRRIRKRREVSEPANGGPRLITEHVEVVGENGVHRLHSTAQTESDEAELRLWLDKCVSVSSEFSPQARSVLLRNRELVDFWSLQQDQAEAILRVIYEQRRKEHVAEFTFSSGAIENPNTVRVSPEELRGWITRLRLSEREVSPAQKMGETLELFRDWQAGKKNVPLLVVCKNLLGFFAVLGSSDVLRKHHLLEKEVVEELQERLRSARRSNEAVLGAELRSCVEIVLDSFERGRIFYTETRPQLTRCFKEWWVQLKKSDKASTHLFERLHDLESGLSNEPSVAEIGISLRGAALPDYVRESEALREEMVRETGISLPSVEELSKNDAVTQKKKKWGEKEGWREERVFEREESRIKTLLLFMEKLSSASDLGHREAGRARASLIRGMHQTATSLDEYLAAWRVRNDTPGAAASILSKMRDLRVNTSNNIRRQQRILFPGITKDFGKDMSGIVGDIEEILPESEAQAFIDAGALDAVAFKEKLGEIITKEAIRSLKAGTVLRIDVHDLIKNTLSQWD